MKRLLAFTLVALCCAAPATASKSDTALRSALHRDLAQYLNARSKIERVWFYQGETYGFRMVHMYFPRQDAVFAFGLNSNPDGKEDQGGKLTEAIYKALHAAGRL